MKRIYEDFGKPTTYLKKMLMRRQRGKCLDCGVDEFDIDNNFHIHRLIKKGHYSLENCILLCPTCHHKRHH